MSVRKRFHYGYWILVASALTTFGAIGLGRFAMGMIIRTMGADMGWDRAMLGVIVSANFIGYLVSTLVSGAIATRLGLRSVIAVSMLLVAVGMVWAGAADNFLSAIAAQALIGIGAGGSNIPASGLIARWFSVKVRGSASGLMTAGSGTGFALSGVIVPYLLAIDPDHGWRISWASLAGVVLILGIAGAIVFRDNPSEVGLGPVGGDGSDEPQASSVSWRSLYGRKSLWELGLIYMMFGYSYVAFTTFYAAYLVDERGFNDAQAGQIWFIIGLVSIASGWLWGWISDRYGRRAALMAVYMLQGSLLIALAEPRIGFMLFPISMVYASTLWGIPAIMSATCADYVGGQLAAAAFGLVTLFFGVGQALSPGISGLISEMTGSYGSAFVLSGFAGITGAGLTLLLPKKQIRV